MNKATTRRNAHASTFQFPHGDAILRNLAEGAAAVPTILLDAVSHPFHANRSFADLLGYSPEEVARLDIESIFDPDDAARMRQQVAALAAMDIAHCRSEPRLVHKDGSTTWVMVTATSLVDEHTGGLRCIMLQAIDIDKQKRAEAALAESESRWIFALEEAGQGVWDHDLRHGTVFYSRMWRMMRGFGFDEEIDGSRDAWLQRVHPDDRERILNESLRQDSGKLTQNAFEYRERHRDGHYIWILSRGRPIEWMPDGSVARIIGTDTDISGLKQQEARAAEEAAAVYHRHLAALKAAREAAEAAEQRAHSLARRDALTGLPNRRAFAEALGTAIARAEQGAGVYAILIMDLDRFKPVNDIHGHSIGDEVLREIAIRLEDLVGRSGTLARLGGDEFGAILDCPVAEDEAGKAAGELASRMLERIREPIAVDGRCVEIGASIGIAMCPADGPDSETLLRAADIAMYRSKQDGRGAFCFFAHGMEAELRDCATLESDLRHAIAKDEIHPHFQPLVRLADNRLVGFEILARWRHPTRGDIGSDRFIPVAERLGLVAHLTYSLLRHACLDARNWPADITLALNVSPTHLTDPSLPVKLLSILSDTGFPPQRLELEITETALVADLPTARAVLAALQAVGITISLDDFGTGYSSLHHLRELRFDKIKIDRSFVLAMSTDAASVKIVKWVVALAESLGMPATAEGIENVDAMKQVVECGAVYGQGYYLGKVMSASEVDKLLRAKGAPGHRQNT